MLITNAEKYQINMELIADQSTLCFLKLFDDKGKEFEETKRLLKRKISGHNPSEKEWRDNALANINAYAYNYVNTIANTIANANANAYSIVNANTYAIANVIENAPGSSYIYDIADYIIGLLDGYIEPIDQLNSKVSRVWDRCRKTHCREEVEIFLHPKGKELEKHFGKWMAATIIHLISTGEILDYFSAEIRRDGRSKNRKLK